MDPKCSYSLIENPKSKEAKKFRAIVCTEMLGTNGGVLVLLHRQSGSYKGMPCQNELKYLDVVSSKILNSINTRRNKQAKR